MDYFYYTSWQESILNYTVFGDYRIKVVVIRKQEELTLNYMILKIVRK